MTVTPPLATESGTEAMVIGELAVEEVTLDLTATDVPPLVAAPLDDDSLLRDPLLPFLVLGMVSLVAVVLTAFLLSSGGLAL